MDKYIEHARRTMDMLNVNMDIKSVRWPLLLRSIMYEQAAEVPPPSCGLTKNVCGTENMHMRSNIYFKSCGLLLKIWGCRPVVAEQHFLKKLRICSWGSASFKLGSCNRRHTKNMRLSVRILQEQCFSNMVHM